MKSILLASASAFAFAGAAAADVSWSGSAAGEYNLPVGSTDGTVTTTVKLNAAASVAGDWTLSTSIAMAPNSDPIYGGFKWSTGTVSLTDGTSTLSFGTDIADGAFEAVMQAYTTTSTTTADDTVDFSASTTLGGVATSLTYDADGDAWQLGASMSLAGFDIDAGFGLTGGHANGMAINASTTMGDLSLGMNVLTLGGTTTSDFSASYTMGAATLSASSDNLTFANDYDLGVKYVMGDSTLSFSINEDRDWNAGVKWASGGTSASVTYNADESAPALNYIKASVGYTMDALTVAASTRTDNNAMSLSGNYDLGNGIKVFAGTRTVTAAENYVGVEAALGAATLTLSYSDTGAGKGSSSTYEKEYKAGTTLGVAFKF